MSNPIFNYTPRVFLNKEKAYELWIQGKTDQEIAEELGVRRDCVYDWRKKNQLERNKAVKRKPVRERSRLSQDALDAKRAGMNYGMWKGQQYEAIQRAKADLARRRAGK